MERRRKNNILIGVLCCALVFMGVGYAILSSVLTISSTANITGDFDIRITSVTPLAAKTTSGATSVSTSVENDNVTANVEVSFNGPGDYITYLVTVENFGTIDGVISEVETNVNNSQYYTIEALDMTTEQALQTPVDLLVGSNPYQFYVRLTFDKDRLISSQSQLDALKTSLTTTLSVRTAQKKSISNQSQTPVVYVDQEDSCFISFRDGEINYYDTSKQGCGSTVTIPDNLRLKTTPLTGVTLNTAVCLGYAGYLKPSSMTNEQFCDNVNSEISEMNYADVFNTIYAVMVTPTFGEPTGEYKLITRIGEGAFTNHTITSANLANSNITSIDAAAFINTSLTQLTLPTNVVTIAEYAFQFNGLTALTLPATLQTIGESAFYGSSISNLTVPASVTSIDLGAFYGNSLTSLDLSTATSLTSIGEVAFYDNAIQTLTLPSSITSIGPYAFSGQHDATTGQSIMETIYIPFTKSDFDNNVTVASSWHDSNEEPVLSVVFLDVTCDRNESNCVANP